MTLNNNNSSNWITGFHVFPNFTVPHLHMHVIYKPLKHTNTFQKETSEEKFIQTETLIAALGVGNNNNSRSGMNIQTFKKKQEEFKERWKNKNKRSNIVNNKPLGKIPPLQFKGGKKHVTNNNLEMILSNNNSKRKNTGIYGKPYKGYFDSPNYNKAHVNHWFPNVSGKNLSDNPKFIIFLNRDRTPYEGQKKKNGQGYGYGSTSLIHILVIPRKYYFNAIELNGKHIDMVKEMKKEGIKAGKDVVKKLNKIRNEYLVKFPNITYNNALNKRKTLNTIAANLLKG